MYQESNIKSIAMLTWSWNISDASHMLHIYDISICHDTYKYVSMMIYVVRYIVTDSWRMVSSLSRWLGSLNWDHGILSFVSMFWMTVCSKLLNIGHNGSISTFWSRKPWNYSHYYYYLCWYIQLIYIYVSECCGFRI